MSFPLSVNCGDVSLCDIQKAIISCSCWIHLRQRPWYKSSFFFGRIVTAHRTKKFSFVSLIAVCLISIHCSGDCLALIATKSNVNTQAHAHGHISYTLVCVDIWTTRPRVERAHNSFSNYLFLLLRRPSSIKLQNWSHFGPFRSPNGRSRTPISGRAHQLHSSKQRLLKFDGANWPMAEKFVELLQRWQTRELKINKLVCVTSTYRSKCFRFLRIVWVAHCRLFSNRLILPAHRQCHTTTQLMRRMLKLNFFFLRRFAPPSPPTLNSFRTFTMQCSSPSAHRI